MWVAMENCSTITNSIRMEEVCRDHPLLVLEFLVINYRFIDDDSLIRSVKSNLRILTRLLHEVSLLDSEARVRYASLELCSLSLGWICLHRGHLRIFSFD